MSHSPAQLEDIRLYCGSSEHDWDGFEVDVGPYACVSPVYGKSLSTKRVNRVRLSCKTVAVIQDSGAFSDGPGQRLSFAAALRRQSEHAEHCGYGTILTHRASYDHLLAEHEDGRHKSRWSEEEAWQACLTTIHAARYLNAHREGLSCILSAQGVTASHYLSCVQGVLPFLRDGDLLGLGGFCILGRRPRQLMPVFREIIHAVIPFAGHEGVKQIHLWGCLYAPALGELLYLCDQYGIALSTDSVGPSLRPVFGRWGYADWTNPAYQRPPRGPLMARDRGDHAALVRDWLRNFRERAWRHYRWCPTRID